MIKPTPSFRLPKSLVIYRSVFQPRLLSLLLIRSSFPVFSLIVTRIEVDDAHNLWCLAAVSGRVVAAGGGAKGFQSYRHRVSRVLGELLHEHFQQ